MDSEYPAASRAVGQPIFDFGTRFFATATGKTLTSEFTFGDRNPERSGLRSHHRGADGDGR